MVWTQANQAKIVRALYTLLIAGASIRPRQQESKTRFKASWSLVGWPMEYAASVSGVAVDCTELMRASEVGDEEATAASAALSILDEIWHGTSFTARDAVKAMTIELKMPWSAPSRGDEKKGARAEALADASGELVGKRLDRPTAHNIGKLFQKRLVGRPAWIGDGLQVGTLRKSPGHNENTYRTEVSDHPAGAKSGNVGKDGNVSAANDGGDGVFSPDAEPARWRARF